MRLLERALLWTCIFIVLASGLIVIKAVNDTQERLVIQSVMLSVDPQDLPYGLKLSETVLNRRVIRTVIIDEIAISELDGVSLTELPDFFMRVIREHQVKVTSPINLDDVKISQRDQWMQLYVEEPESDDAYLKRLRSEATRVIKRHEAKIKRDEETQQVTEKVKKLYASGQKDLLR